MDGPNHLLSTKPSNSNVTISLHPLVLLTISDHITRHHVRNQEGPIVGALLGQLKGRETTLEHAFQCKTVLNNAGEVVLDEGWFLERLQQYKDVHKAPVLEFVGWFTLCPENGPTTALLPLHKQIMLKYNESALLLGFHTSAITASASAANGRLPLTIYESTIEVDPTKDTSSMQIDGEDLSGIKFRPLPYTIETDETEMIAIDYVAKGAGNATAVTSEPERPTTTDAQEGTETKGKKRPDQAESEKTTIGLKDTANQLSPEEEDQIASITTRLNSVRMLQSRLSLLSRFIRSQQPSYLSDPSIPITPTCPDPATLPHLRNIQALLTRLSLLTPTPEATAMPTSSTNTTWQPDLLSLAAQAQSNDVTLSSLLSLLGQGVQGMSEMGRKYAAVESVRQQKSKGKVPFVPGGFPGLGGPGGEDAAYGGSGMMV